MILQIGGEFVQLIDVKMRRPRIAEHETARRHHLVPPRQPPPLSKKIFRKFRNERTQVLGIPRALEIWDLNANAGQFVHRPYTVFASDALLRLQPSAPSR
jgi:hypothetical protein